MDFKKITIVIISLIIAIFLICAIIFHALNKSDGMSTYYQQGLQYYNKSDFQNAYFNFSKIPPGSKLFLNAVYKQAKCADMLDDKKTAIKKYEILYAFIKDENIAPFILWRIGNLYKEQNNNSKARSAFLKLKKQYPETEYGIGASYMLYKLESKDEYLLEYLKNSPDGRYSKTAISVFYPSKIPFLSSEEKIILVKSMQENSLYKDSIEVLKSLPINMSWPYLIKSLDKLNSPENINKVANKGFAFSNTNIEEDLLDEVIDISIKADKNGKAKALNYIFETSKNEKIKALALYKNSIYSPHAESIRKKQFLYEKYPNSKYAKTALFDLFEESLINNKPIQAKKYGKTFINIYKDRNLTPCVLYFVALETKKEGDPTYKSYLNKLINEYSNSYYAYLAYSNMINPRFSKIRNYKIKNKQKIEYPYDENKTIKSFYENFVKEDDLSVFNDFRVKDPKIKSWIEYTKDNKALSSVIARDYIQTLDVLPKRNDVVWQLAYPIYYSKEINSHSKEKQLNPYLVLSLIKEESHFNPNIISSAGAVGLTQVMPATAQMVTGISYSIEELKTPDLNIDIGTKYFSYLMEIFSNDERLCVLSYNSGPNAVKSWLNKSYTTNFDIFVERIPYLETKTYIKKVFGTYWNYVLTYENIKF